MTSILNSITPNISLNYSGRGATATRTRHVSSYTSRRLAWSTGVDNMVDITIAQEDRRPMNIINREIVFTLWDAKTNSTYFRRRALATEPEIGGLRLIVPAADTAALPPGLYNLSATIIDADGYETMLTWDQDQRGSFDVELSNDVMPPARATDVLDTWTLSDGVYVTSAIDGPTESTMSSGLFSVAIYVTDYRGSVKIQGTLDQTLNGMNTLWADLTPQDGVSSTIVMTGFTGIMPLNFQSNMRWLRALRIDAGNNTGSLDKILIRV